MEDPDNAEDMLEKVTREKICISTHGAIWLSIGEDYLRNTVINPEEMGRSHANLVRFAGNIMDDLMKIDEEKWREGVGSIDHHGLEAIGASTNNVADEDPGLLTGDLREEVEVVKEAEMRDEELERQAVAQRRSRK